jgi:RNA polymerase sigma-70 factor, ECF subfamily
MVTPQCHTRIDTHPSWGNAPLAPSDQQARPIHPQLRPSSLEREWLRAARVTRSELAAGFARTRVTCQTDGTNESDVGAICYALETQPSHEGIRASTPEVRSSNDMSADFEAITLPSLRDLHRKARRMLNDASIAEDVVQETCLRAWQNFDRFTPGTNARAWLFAILMKVVQTEYRRRERWRVVPQSEEILENYAAPTSTNTEVLTDEGLLGVIESIPLHYRQVLLMADVAELQYQEIAQALRIPMGTVMSRLSRARARARSELMDFLKITE